MATQLQVVWSELSHNVSGEDKVFKRGDLLPETTDAGELAVRATLLLGGAVRPVEVVYTEAEMAEAVKAAAARADEAAKPEAQVGTSTVVLDDTKGRSRTASSSSKG